MSAIVICKVYVETICVVEAASFDPLRKAKSVIFFPREIQLLLGNTRFIINIRKGFIKK